MIVVATQKYTLQQSAFSSLCFLSGFGINFLNRFSRINELSSAIDK